MKEDDPLDADFPATPPGEVAQICGPVPPQPNDICDAISLKVTDAGTKVAVTADGPASRDGALTDGQKARLGSWDLYIEVLADVPDAPNPKPSKIAVLPQVVCQCGRDDHMKTVMIDVGEAAEDQPADLPNNATSTREVMADLRGNSGVDALGQLFGRFMDFNTRAAAYHLFVSTCGTAAKGPGTPELKGFVAAMPKDEWRITAKLSAGYTHKVTRRRGVGVLDGRTTSREYMETTRFGRGAVGGAQRTSSEGTVLEGRRDGVTYTTTTASDGGRTYSVAQTSRRRGVQTTETSGSDGSHKRRRDLQASVAGMPVGVEVKHNGVGVNVATAANKVLNWIKTIEEYAERMIPKVQFGWGFEFAFLEVGAGAYWALSKEQVQRGPRVALLEREAAIFVEGVFVRADISFGIDTQFAGFGLVAKIGIKGSIGVDAQWVLGEDDVSITPKGELMAYGKGEVFIDALFFKGGAEFRLEGKVKGEWEIEMGAKGVSDQVEAVFTGIVFIRETKGLFGGRKTKKSQWCGPRDIVSKRPGLFSG